MSAAATTATTATTTVTHHALDGLCAQRLAGVLTQPARLTPRGGDLLARSGVLHLEFQPALGLACEANVTLGPDDYAQVEAALPELRTGALVSVGGEGVRLAEASPHHHHARDTRLHLINARQLVIPSSSPHQPGATSC